MMINYGCLYKRSGKPITKGSRVETIEAARREYMEPIRPGVEKRIVSYVLLFVKRAIHPPKLYNSLPVDILRQMINKKASLGNSLV